MRRGLLITLIGLMICASGIAFDAHTEIREEYDDFRALDFVVPLPKIHPTPSPMPTEIINLKYRNEFDDLEEKIDGMTITYYELILIDTYDCFITAYCAEECGWNYETSSGSICHRSGYDERYEPTTCAVDLKYFGYDTLFYIPSEDRIYIAEDTGAFRGFWLDLYQDDMEEVRWFNTRYETIYTCEFVEREIVISENNIFDYLKEVINESNTL